MRAFSNILIDIVTTNRRGIYYAKLDGSESGTVYETPDHIIDGLALNPTGTRLFWTDYLGGRIASVALTGESDTYAEFVTDLDKPRAITVTDRYGAITVI